MADSDFIRVCTHCNIAFPANLEFFPPHKPGKFGLHSLCKTCKKEIDAARRSRPDQKARQQAWRDANKEAVKKANAEYRASGYKSTRHVKAWIEANPDRNKEIHREKVRRWRRTVPWYSLKSRISTRINMMLKNGYGPKAGRTTRELLGYDLADLAAHIESKFTAGMTWEKFMAGEIHLDHIVPVSHFKPSCVDSKEFKDCWAISNLQPLWAADNIAKSNKMPVLA